MSDARITDLTTATTPLAGTEVLPLVQSNTTKQVTIADVTAGRTVSATAFNDAKGNVRLVPKSGATKTGSYTLAASDTGMLIEVGGGGSIEIPDAVFSTGDVVSIFNNTTGTITITCTITTAYIAGVDADEASVDLATRGIATILFISGTVCVISGNVS